MQASVQHLAEGYAADMGWLQVVRYDVRDAGEKEHQVVFDVPPHLSETETPYAAFAVRPTFFDAPAAGAKDMTWDADTFLAYTPDAVLSRIIHPLCGFSWGYRASSGVIQLSPLAIAGPEEWERNLPICAVATQPGALEGGVSSSRGSLGNVLLRASSKAGRACPTERAAPLR